MRIVMDAKQTPLSIEIILFWVCLVRRHSIWVWMSLIQKKKGGYENRIKRWTTKRNPFVCKSGIKWLSYNLPVTERISFLYFLFFILIIYFLSSWNMILFYFCTNKNTFCLWFFLFRKLFLSFRSMIEILVIFIVHLN